MIERLFEKKFVTKIRSPPGEETTPNGLTPTGIAVSACRGSRLIGTTAFAPGLVMYAREPSGTIATCCPLVGTATLATTLLTGSAGMISVNCSGLDTDAPTCTVTAPVAAPPGTSTEIAAGSYCLIGASTAPKKTWLTPASRLKPLPERTTGSPTRAAGASIAFRASGGGLPVASEYVPGFASAFPFRSWIAAEIWTSYVVL